MKRAVAGLCTTIIMGFLFWNGLRESHSRKAPPAQERPGFGIAGTTFQTDSEFKIKAELQGAADRIEGLLASARQGDAASYLAAFGGPLRARLEREAGERGRVAFARRLRRAGEARTSHAVFAPEPDGDRTGAARVAVESTFADRVERQTFRLERTHDGWLVTEVEAARDHIPQNPLGSLATYTGPEGIPVTTDSVESAGDTTRN